MYRRRFIKLPPDLFRVDRELIIVFLLVAIAGFIFFFVSNQRAFLNFFYLPVLGAAYFFGKRHATLAAVLSVLLITLIAIVYPNTFLAGIESHLFKWLDISTWGGFLVLTGFGVGLLYERKEKALIDVKQTYWGIVEMLSIVIDSVDRDTKSHSHRVAKIAEIVARAMKCPEDEVENIRAAAMLHDLGKLGVSSDILRKIGTLTDSERHEIRKHPQLAADIIGPLGGKVLNILPYILYHHEQFDGSGYHNLTGSSIPLGARIIAVSDVYDALTSDRPYRKGIMPFEAKRHINDNSGTYFDPAVVSAFNSVFHSIETEALAFPAASF